MISEKGLNRKSLANFWIRRWYRTLPNYFLILITLCVLNLLFDPDFRIGETVRYFFFSQNLFYIHPGFFPEAWSLSVEEWFYLLMPVLVLLLTSLLKLRSGGALLTTVIIIILFATLFRFYRYSTTEIKNIIEREHVIRKQVFTQLDSMMFGVLGAYVNHHYSAFWVKNKKTFLYIGLVLFLIAKVIENFFKESTPFNGLYHCVFGFSMTSIATLCLLPYLSNFKTLRKTGFLYHAITYISIISYSVYLVNLSIVQLWIINKINWQLLLAFGFSDTQIVVIKYVMFYLLTYLLSALIYKYYEVPMTRLRDRRKIIVQEK